MQDEIAIDLRELTKLVVVCPNPDCGAELSFDLKKKLFIKAVTCHVCNATVLEVNPRQDGSESTWAFSFKKLLEAEGKPRMFFRVSRSG